MASPFISVSELADDLAGSTPPAVLDASLVLHAATFDGDYAIEIADVELAWEAGDAVVVTYIEKQERRGIKTARRATALFVESSSAPNGVEWRHLHETWMQTAE